MIGVVLLLSITMIGITAVAASGAAVLGDAQEDSQMAQVENSMSQMSSKAGLVALGRSETHAFDLGDLGDGTVEVREDAGTVTVTHDDGEKVTELYNGTYGAVVATVGETEIAYQGGGVWRKGGDRSVMVSPPEYHYQQRTLTFPIVRVVGDDRASGRVTGRLVSVGDGESIYPDGTAERTNPLEDGKVEVEIQSEYYQGWYDFFDARTEGRVEIDHENRTVTVELDIPFETNIENAVAVTDPDGITFTGKGEKPEPHEEGVNYPSASPIIDSRIQNCETGETDCGAIIDDTITHTEETDGTYFASGSDVPNSLTVKTGNQDINVNVVIDGDFEPSSVSIEGNGTVSLYVKGDFTFGGSTGINDEGEASQLFVYLHSDVSSSKQHGNPSFTGVIYAPNTSFTLNGSMDFNGALISKSLHITGKPAGTFTYDEGLTDQTLKISGSSDSITYLHITENGVEVELQ